MGRPATECSKRYFSSQEQRDRVLQPISAEHSWLTSQRPSIDHGGSSKNSKLQRNRLNEVWKRRYLKETNLQVHDHKTALQSAENCGITFFPSEKSVMQWRHLRHSLISPQ